jgi:hypothetical protein
MLSITKDLRYLLIISSIILNRLFLKYMGKNHTNLFERKKYLIYIEGKDIE